MYKIIWVLIAVTAVATIVLVLDSSRVFVG